MAYSVGEEVKGTVSGITSFGAFVALPDGETGMIHISKLSRGFVKDVASAVKIGDPVTATVIGIKGNRIALSLIGMPESGVDHAPKRRKDDFESMLSSFRSSSDDRLSALRGTTRGERERKRR
ncbi:MAG: S1 RNA-binding domain-containing protein [Clostridia bacterium]|nr:S1 RNA-binding domain-containing protein [Clostridia bacterium]